MEGRFSATGDLIERHRLEDSPGGGFPATSSGIFSKGYKDQKEQFWNKFEIFQSKLEEFYQGVFRLQTKHVEASIPGDSRRTGRVRQALAESSFP